MRAQRDASLAAVGSHYTAATAKQWGRWIYLTGQPGKYISFLLAGNSASFCLFSLNAAGVHPSCLMVKMEHELDKSVVNRTAKEKDRRPVALTPTILEAI